MLPCSPKTEKFQLLSVEAVRDDRLGTANDLLIKELDKLERELATLPDTLSDAAEGVALTELEAINGEIKELRTKIKRAKSQGFAGKYKSVQLRVADLGNRISSLAFAGFKEKAFFWRSPCKVITKKLKPQHTQKIERLDLSMARGECRDLAFMLSAMGGDLNVRLAFESAEPSLAGNVELFFTDYLQYNAQNDWIADLIVPAGTKSINVPKGESREIRIRFFAGAGGVAPGTHAFLLHLGDETSGFRCSLEGSLEVWPFELVSQREIDVLCYAEFKSASQEQVASHFEELAAMKKYGLNVIEIFPQMLNQCRFDNEGNLLEFNARGMELNILEIKRMWNKIPGSQALKFYLICGNNENLPEDMCSPAYENALQQYIGKIAETMQSFGISTDEYFVVLGDEASQAALLKEIPMAEIIKRRHPQLKLLQNSNARFDSEETMRRYFAAFDYFMPCYTGFTWDEGLWPILSQSGKVQATYKCEAMGSTDSPLYEYYRLYPWNTFRLGLRNLGIWSFNARNRLENPLLNHLKCGYSLVVRNKDDSVHHTRRYEIFHEGLSDLRYLITLQQMAENKDGGAAGVKEFLIATLQEVLGNSADTSLAEGGRLKIAGKIMELRK
jgi:hypothetical protein